MANGRLERESNPIQGEKPGYYPQHETNTAGEFETTGKRNPLPTTDSIVLAKLQEMDDKIQGIIDGSSPANTQLTGSTATLNTTVSNFPATQNVNVLNQQEQKFYALQENYTQKDETSGELIFLENIEGVDIYNLNQTDEIIFTINSLVITVPPDATFEALVGGVPSNVVTVSGNNRDYVIGRLG